MSDKDKAHCRIAGEHDWEWLCCKDKKKQVDMICKRCNTVKPTSSLSIKAMDHILFNHMVTHIYGDHLLPFTTAKKKRGSFPSLTIEPKQVAYLYGVPVYISNSYEWECKKGEREKNDKENS